MQFSVGSNMMKVRARRRRFSAGSLLLLLMFGIIFLIIGIAILMSDRINSSWVRVTGKVTDITTTTSNNTTLYAPVVTYSVGGQDYTVTSDVSTTIFPQTGSGRQIAYDPRLPASAVVVQSGGVRAVYYIVPLVGVVMLIAGPLAYLRSRRRNSNLRQLEQAGQKHPGIIVDIQTSRSGNGANGYRLIIAAENDNGAVQNYMSDVVPSIGALSTVNIHARPIPIDVYIDPAKPDNYYVDVSELPNLTAQRITELIQSIAPPPKLELASISSGPAAGESSQASAAAAIMTTIQDQPVPETTTIGTIR